MKRCTPTLALPLLAFASLLNEDCAAQTLPSFWDRDVDWVAPPDAAHGTTQGNPAPDSEGNLVWHYEFTQTGGGLGTANPWYEEPMMPQLWDQAWFGGSGGWAPGNNFGSVIKSSAFTHAGQWPDYRPMVRWKNVTGQTFEAQLRGSLWVGWSGDFSTAQAVDVDLIVAHRDGSTGALTLLYSATIPKPSNNTMVESLLVPINVAPLTIGVGDELLISHHAWEATANGKWITVNDGPLCIVRDPIGTRYCGPAVTNSRTYPGEMAAAGSTRIADDDFTIKAIQLPFNSFGLFLTSRSQGFAAQPGGSQGNLCLGGAIGRFIGPNQVFPTGIYGTGSLQLDLQAMPTPAQGLVVVQPGDTWNFQCWYRDANPGVTSNFTDAISVTYQ